MDNQTDFISRIIFRAVDEVSATLRAIAAEMDAVEARVRATEAVYSSAIAQLEAYEVKAGAVGKEMAIAGGTSNPALLDQYGNALRTTGAAAAQAETQTRALVAAENEAAAAGAKAEAGAVASAAGATKSAAAADMARKSWKSFSTSLLLIGGIAASIIGVSGTMAAHFQSDMELIKTQAHASQVEVNNMSGAVLNMATAVGTGPDQLAAGLYHVESAGFRSAQALNIERAAAEGAKVGHASLESVTQSLVAVTASHIKGVHDQIQAMGILNGIVGAGDMRMQQLADALSTGVVESAKTFGLSIQDVGAGLATLGDNLMQGSEAGTRFRMTLALMAAPSGPAIKALAEIGLKATTLADDMRKPQGLLVALEDLKKHLQDSGMTASQQAEVLSHAFGGGRSSAVLLTLLDQLDRLKSKYGDVAAGAQKFGADWAATQKTVAFQMDQVGAAMKVIAIQLGSAFLPVLHNALTVLVPVISAFAQWAQGHEAVVQGILAIGVALGALGLGLKAYLALQALVQSAKKADTVASTAVTIATKAWTAAQWLLNAALGANPIGLTIIAVAALAAGIIYAYTHSEQFRQIVNQLASAIGEKLVGAIEAAKQLIQWAIDRFHDLQDSLKTTHGQILAMVIGFGLLGPAIVPVVLVLTHLKQVTDFVKTALSDAGKMIGGFLDMLAKASKIPVLGGLIGATPVGELASLAQGFAHIGSALDNYAVQAGVASEKSKELTVRNERLKASIDHVTTAVKQQDPAIHQTGTTHTTVTQKMTQEAGRVESAWDRIGKKIAIAGIALAGVIAGNAHAQGAAAASSYSAQYQAAAIGSSGITASQIALTRAQMTGSTAAVLGNAGNGMTGTSAGMNTGLAGFQSVVNQLPATFAQALTPVINQYRAQIQQLNNQQAAAIRSEDQRHIQALQSIQTQHQQALKQHASSVQASLTQHTQTFNQSVQSHVAAIKQAHSDYTSKVKSLHDAYVQKLDSIHGKNAAERRKAAEESYQNQLKAAKDHYEKIVAANDAGIAKAKQGYDTFLSRQKSSNDAYISKQDQSYREKIAKEDQVHKKNLADLEKAFKGHAAGIEKALKTASSPTAMVNSLSSQLQTDYDKALNKVTLDFLEHGKASKADTDAVKKAEAQQQKLTAAQWDATFKTADAATKAQMLSQRFQGLISQFDSKSGEKQAVQQDKLQILADKAQLQLDQLKAVETAITSQTAVMQAEAGVAQAKAQAQVQATTDQTSIIQAQSAADQADATAQIQAIKDQTSVFEAQQAVVQAGLSAQLTAVKDQGAILQAQGDIAKARSDIANATDAQSLAQAQASLRVGQDNLQIAQATYAMDQRQAAFDQKIAADNLKIAQDTAAQNKSQAQWDRVIAQAQLQAAKDTAAMNRVMATWDIKIAQDQLTIANHQAIAAQLAAQHQLQVDDAKIVLDQANLALTKAQNQLQTDQLYTQVEIRDAIGGVNEYGEDITSDLSAINAAQGQVNAATRAYQQAQQAQALSAQQQAIIAAQDQQKLAADQAAKAQDQITWQQRIAQDQQQIAQDEASRQDDSLTWQQKLAQDQQQLSLDNAAKTQASIEDQTQIQQDQNQAIIDGLADNTAATNNVAAAVQSGNNADATYYGQMLGKADELIYAYRNGIIVPRNAALSGSAQQDSFSVDNHSSVTP